MKLSRLYDVEVLGMESYFSSIWSVNLPFALNGTYIISSLCVNLFMANVGILYLLETTENLWFSGIFRGYKIETLTKNGLSQFELLYSFMLSQSFFSTPPLSQQK